MGATEDERTTSSNKGLAVGTVSLLSSIIIGISCVAPAYSLTASLGPIVATSGTQTPAVIFAGFVPMLLVAFGYRELNRAMPDSGTTFTWATRAFGPWVGWIAGWGLLASYVLVLSNMAGVAVDFFYQLLAQMTRRPGLAALADDPGINIATCFAFMTASTLISCRGMEATKAFQYVLIIYQVAVMILFAIVALAKVGAGQAFDALPVRASWFDPFAIGSFHALTAGVSLSIFIFWGWDVVLTINEESRHARTTPGKAGTSTVCVTMLLYLLASAAAMSFAGLGAGTFGLGNTHIQQNVFLGLAEPVLGPLALLMTIGVLASAAASLQSTMVGPSRTFLAMGHYQALPRCLATISPRHGTPTVGILVSAIVSSLFYALMKIVSQHVLQDTITALGIMICFYYCITAFAAVRYFRGSWFGSIESAMFRLVFPTLGGTMLGLLFCVTLANSLDPAFGTGSQFHGIGLVFILGMGIIATGLVLMTIMALIRPAFFRGAILPVQRAGPASGAQGDGTAA